MRALVRFVPVSKGWLTIRQFQGRVTESSSTDYKQGELDTRMEHIYMLHCTGQRRPPMQRRNEHLPLPRPKKESAWPQAGEKPKRAVLPLPRRLRRSTKTVISRVAFLALRRL